MRVSFVLVLCIVACTAIAQPAKITVQHIQIVKATRSSVSPGIVKDKSTSRGTSIYQLDIKLKSKKASSIKIESLLIDQQVLNVELIKGTERGATGPFAKGDTLLVLARSESSAGTPSAALQKIIASKKNISAWLVYSIGSKQYLMAVQQFELSSNEKQNQ